MGGGAPGFCLPGLPSPSTEPHSCPELLEPTGLSPLHFRDEDGLAKATERIWWQSQELQLLPLQHLIQCLTVHLFIQQTLSAYCMLGAGPVAAGRGGEGRGEFRDMQELLLTSPEYP